MGSFIKFLIQNQLHVKSNQIHGCVTVHSIKCLPPKIGGQVFLPSYVILDFSDFTITKSANLSCLMKLASHITWGEGVRNLRIMYKLGVLMSRRGWKFHLVI